MLTLSHTMAVLIGAVMAIWLGLAVWAVWTGLKLRKRAEFSTSQADRLASLLESAPALPLMVRNDGRIEAPERLGDWLGLPKVPNFVSDLAGHNCGLTDDDAAALVRDVSAVQRSGRSFSRAIRAQGSSRTLLVRGAPAAVRLGSSGAVILWWFDATESQAEIGRLGEESARLKLAFDRLSGLIEAAPMPMWHRGPDMRIALVNNAYVRAVEAESAADVIARGLELVDVGAEASPLAAAQRARETNQPVSRVVPITVGGERRAARIVDVPLGDAGVAGFAMDVEEVERANAAFRRFVASQRDTLDRLSAGVAQFGADRSLLFCNQPFVRQFALKQEWVAERPDFDRLLDRMREANRVPETRDFPGWKAEHREWFMASDGVQEENWLLPDGAHLRVVAQPLPDGGLLAIFEDRTEQAQLASARDTLLRVRTATFDNMFEAVGVFESDGRLHLWNSRFRQVWDFDEDFLAGHPHVDALAEAASSKLLNASRASLIREMVRSATVERQQRSGRLALKNGRHFEFAAVPLPDGNALFTMLDISDSRRVESVLRERADALEEANRVKSSFVANMSYELRTPLTSISGFAEMLQQGFGGQLEEQGRAYVAAILDSTERLSGLVDKVLDLTQSDAGQLPLERKPVDIAAMLEEAARDHRPSATAKAIDFAIEIDQTVGMANGDARRLRQVFDHLLENSFAYTPEGGRILIHAEGNKERAVVIVSDNGPGMNMAEQTAALDRFGRVAEGRSSEPALGLGLPLAKQFVEAHGGTLSLVSEPGQGTLVRIELPR
ncbi:MAG: PAS-domain containing protein [Sphingomonadales bacterium]|jgi:signal transduction histidine kinase|nr:PAS-domain containing protein [Sphingomonadales bacterium]